MAAPAPRASSESPSPHFQPYVPDNARMPEFTISAVVLGAVLGIVFGASSLYLVLKVGLTVSASIPVAVLSITLFRAFSKAFGIRPATILENNIVQTAGSAGESIAFGVGVTMPALMLLGFEMSVTRVMVVSLLGGLLGILMMIPLRRAFVVRLHGKAGEPGKLLYPEGTACAEVLKSGEAGGASGKTVFIGFGLAFAHKFLTEGMGVLRATVTYPLKEQFNRVAALSGEMASELLGVGYIIGFRTSAIMMAGAVLGYLVIAPTIAVFGDQMTTIMPPGDKLIRDMELKDIRANYLLFIGAGCVAAAGVISMFRTLPMIVRSVVSGLGSLGGGALAGGSATRRTDDDMPMKAVLFGGLGLLVLLALFLAPEVGPTSAVMGALLVLAFGFLFVTVSSRLTGEIGSSSNPISGMTVATLSLTCLIFLGLQMTSPVDRVLALSIGAIVCIAASNGGTTSQDLKTGFLVGATPRLQQWAILIGALTSAVVIGGTLLLFNQSGTVYTQQNLPAGLNLKDRLSSLTETETYEGKTYHVWWSNREDAAAGPSAPAMSATATPATPLTATAPSGPVTPSIRPGKYLVDDAGEIRYFVDPAITGKLNKRDDGSDVKLKFEAPKTQVMALIINGVLKKELNWALVLIGAMIAVTLELCGISSLAFAVGVYVPMQYSVPIFCGGVVRWAIDRWSASRRRAAAGAAAHDEAADIAASETSPGVLLSSGYIAGGSLAGVAVAFLEFAPESVRNGINMSEHVEFLKNADYVALGVFAALIAILIIIGQGRADGDNDATAPRK